MVNALINPNKKQPTILTIKILSICHLNKAPGTAPNEIRKNLFRFKKKYLIYQLATKNPSAMAIIPKENDKANNLNALKNLNLLNKSNKS